MDDLRLTFLIFGVVAIVAILVHGMWTIRKTAASKKRKSRTGFNSADGFYEKKSPSDSDNASHDFDEHGVGSVRVLSDVEPIPPIKIEASADTQFDESEAALRGADSNSALVDDDIVISGTGISNTGISETVVSDSLISETMQTTDTQEPTLSNTDDFTDENPSASSLSDLSLAASDMDFGAVSTVKHVEEAPSETTQLYGSVVTQPKPEFLRQKHSPEADSVIPAPPASLLKNDSLNSTPETVESDTQNREQQSDVQARPDLELVSQQMPSAQSDEARSVKDQSADTSVSVAAQQKIEPEPTTQAPEATGFAAQARRLVSRKRKSVGEKIRKEPKINSDTPPAEDQMRIDFDDTQKAASASPKSSASEQQQEVLILHVKAPDDTPIQGAALLPMLLTLGFKFGEQDIFHRHVNTNGKGQVLFSLANMFKPGHFDIDAMETFTTRGLALFMMLPIEGDPQQVFNMMHNATRKLAEEFGCEVLDEKRQPLSKVALQKCSEKIRAFERGKHNI